jgi:hypothetical protein
MTIRWSIFLITLYTICAGYLNALNPLNAFCYRNNWDVSECKVTTLYEDGETASTVFIPEKEQNVTTDTCFKFGCHPMYCGDWRQSIRQACKKEYTRQQKLASKFLRGPQKKVSSESFDGCAVLPTPSGLIYPLDLIGRKTMPESWYAVCTQDTEAQESAFYKWAKENSASIMAWFKTYGSKGWESAKGFMTPQQSSSLNAPNGKILPTKTSPFGTFTKSIVAREEAQARAEAREAT